MTADVNRDIYLECLQADKARDSKAIDDVFLAGHRLFLPPTRRLVSPKAWPAISPTGTDDTVCATSLSIRAGGHGRGPLLGQVHSPPPLSVSLWSGPAALSWPTASARAFHVQAPRLFSNSNGTKQRHFMQVLVRWKAPNRERKRK